MKKYYLAGPMSGKPQFNFQTFFEVAAKLRSQHYGIISPAELDDEETRAAALASPDGAPSKRGKVMCNKQTWGDFLARDVKIIADQVQGIIFLPDWEKSRGARLEAMVGLLQPDFTFLAWHEGEQCAIPIGRITVACIVHVETVK